MSMARGRFFNFLLLIVSALALMLGVMTRLAGHATLANWIWLAGSLPVLLSMSFNLIRLIFRRDMGLDIIALLSTGGALLLGEYLTAIVISLMLASGRTLEDFADARARREMSALLNRVPRMANRYESNGLIQIPITEVVAGDRLLVRGGEVVPADGIIETAVAVLDESVLTGESLPVRRGIGESVRSGVVNAAGPFDLLAKASAADSTYAGIVRLVKAAQQSKAPSSRLADRYALVFVPLSMAVAAMAWALSGDPMRALAVLVVATPCPLILAVPVAIVSGMSRCASRGVLIKGGGMLEKFAQAKVLYFDKTGTLTAGHPRLVAIEVDPAFDPNEMLRTAASLDQISQHVLAEAVVSFARRRGLPLAMPSNIEEEHGAGIVGDVDGRRVAVGSYAYVSSSAAHTEWAARFLKRMAYEGAAGVFVAIDGVMAGALLLADEIRLETPRALRMLRKAGIERIVMLTGDHRDVARTIAAALGVDEVMADQTPADKLLAIESSHKGHTTVMVGDGINDAPALAAADVGVAMGARGAAASSEVAGIVLFVDRLDRLAEALGIARRTRKIAIQSVVAGMGLSFIAMAVATFGYLPPLAGAILQEAIDVAVILNALRALRIASANRGRVRLGATQARELKAEHDELGPVLDRIRTCADRLPSLLNDEIHAELAELDGLLEDKLLPHERSDESVLYPQVERMLGGEDALASMSRTHREILRLGHLFHQMSKDLSPGNLSPSVIQEFQRILYGLDAILRLHFAQEEEIYYTLTEAA